MMAGSTLQAITVALNKNGLKWRQVKEFRTARVSDQDPGFNSTSFTASKPQYCYVGKVGIVVSS